MKKIHIFRKFQWIYEEKKELYFLSSSPSLTSVFYSLFCATSKAFYAIFTRSEKVEGLSWIVMDKGCYVHIYVLNSVISPSVIFLIVVGTNELEKFLVSNKINKINNHLILLNFKWEDLIFFCKKIAFQHTYMCLSENYSQSWEISRRISLSTVIYIVYCKTFVAIIIY